MGDWKRKSSSEFWNAYKHPNWQRKRLELLQAANFECQYCGNKDETLEVHHRHYIKGRKPWEYENHAFDVLCTSCHEHETWVRAQVNLLWQYISPSDSEVVYGFLNGLAWCSNEENRPESIGLLSAEHANGVMAALALHTKYLSRGTDALIASRGNDNRVSNLEEFIKEWAARYEEKH